MSSIEDRLEHRRATIICAIGAIHFVLSIALLFSNGASTMSRFEGGGPSDLTALLLNWAFEVVSFPLVTAFMLMKIGDTGISGWLVFLANSGLWGWAGWRAIRLRRSWSAAGADPA